MPENMPLAARVHEAASIRGTFQLRSGAQSDHYFDKYLFESDPALLKEIASAMLLLIPDGTEALAGLEMGGIPIATVLSQLSGIPTLFVRKTRKSYGTCRIVEGGSVSRRVVIVEDVISTGGQILESAQAMQAEGAEILRVLCVIDRETRGRENLAAVGLELASLFTMTLLKTAI